MIVLCRLIITINCHCDFALFSCRKSRGNSHSLQATSKSHLFYYSEVQEVGDWWTSHHGCAAEKDIVADGGEEFHALLQTILRREDNNTIRLLQEHKQQTLVILKTWSLRTRHNLIWRDPSGLWLLWLESMSICEGVIECSLYHRGVFHQSHVVTAERHYKQHSPDILETTNPLPPLSSLASNVIHPANKERWREQECLTSAYR